MEIKIIEDKKSGDFIVYEWDGVHAAEVHIIGREDTREKAEKLLAKHA
jgi:hypothetical protein